MAMHRRYGHDHVCGNPESSDSRHEANDQTHSPENSAQIARKASGAGMCMVPVKNPIVPANPEPPNHPSIFCAPSAKKTTPKTSLKITVAMLSSVETIVRIMFFLPACLA